jgi:predicted acylesterase/phospholipase RssA/ABC-type phosphate/phosphonate transport system substrate-binding protein
MWSRLSPSIACWLLVFCLSVSSLNVYGQQTELATQLPSIPAITLRVGVVAYEDFHVEHARFKQWLHQVSASTNPPIRFQLTTGSYSEIAHWMKHGSVDAALITGGGFATLGVLDQDTDEFDYIATLDSQPATGPWASENRKLAGFHGLYHAVCITNGKSTISSAADLAAVSQQGKLRVLFVDRRSASGNIIPRLALQEIGVEIREADVRYLGSHSQVLHELAQESGAANTTTIGFVWDDAGIKVPQLLSKLRKVEFPELTQRPITHDALVIRQDFPHSDELSTIIQRQIESSVNPPFQRLESGKQPYIALRRSAKELGIEAAQLLRKDTRGVGNMLVQAYRQQSSTNPFRLALVLSGGGAKCAYQVGAVSEIEDAIAELNAHNQTDISIDLVVGTSGGAINAVPVSMKMSADEVGQQKWQEVWLGLDQREIVLPARSVRINIGIWIALLQVAGLLALLRVLVRDPARRRILSAQWVSALGGIELALVLIPFTPWSLLGHNHLLHHLWLWLSLGAQYTAITLLLLGGSSFVWNLRFKRQSDAVHKIRRLRTGLLLTVGILGLPLLQIGVMFLGHTTLSSGAGMTQEIYKGFSGLVGAGSGNAVPVGNSAMKLEQLSKSIFEQGLVQRDLVLTATAIAKNRNSLPSDLYFFYAADKNHKQPRYGNRGVDIRRHPEQLLKIVLGSSSIYPVFPAQELIDVPNQGDRIELVDGGFAHNAPLEAAVLWGATHVVLIDAAPAQLRDGTNLADSMLRGFGHLFQQSQLSDKRSKDAVMVFTLESRFQPKLCVLDFANVLVERGIYHGRQDVIRSLRYQDNFPPDQLLPPFVVTYGQPRFEDIVAPVKSALLGP